MVTDQQKEAIVQSYSCTFDKDLAYDKIGLSQEEKNELNNDIEFQRRLSYFLTEEKEKIITNLRSFMDSPIASIKFKATTEMALLLYPEFFNSVKNKKKSEGNLLDYMTEEDLKGYIDTKVTEIVNSRTN